MVLVYRRQRVDFPIVDKEGQTGIMGFYSQSFEDPNDESVEMNNLYLAVKGLSIGAVNVASFSEQSTDSAPEVATTGSYQNKEDKAVFLFKSSKNNTVTYECPCPDATLFTSDAETIDALDAAVAAFITAVLNFAADKAGNAIIAFLRGYRKRAKLSRK